MLEGIFWFIIHLILKWFSGLLLNYSVMDDNFWKSSDSLIESLDSCLIVPCLKIFFGIHRILNWLII